MMRRVAARAPSEAVGPPPVPAPDVVGEGRADLQQRKPVIGIVTGFSTGIGGVEAHMLSLLRRARGSSYRFAVFAPPEFVSRAAAEGVPGTPWMPRASWDLRAARRLLALLCVTPVDALHIHDARAGVIGRLVAKRLRIPVVYTVHLPPYAYVAGRHRAWKRWAYRVVEGFLNRHLTHFTIHVSERLYQQAVQLGVTRPGKATVIHNGVDTTRRWHAADRQALGTPELAVIVTLVGRLTEQKGVDVLLMAVAMLKDLHDLMRVWIVGDGPLRGRLEEQAAGSHLGEVVQFLGDRSDVPSLLAASDIFVLPSRYEGLPMTLLEAMAAGLPCVATDVGGNGELVDHSVTGWLVAQENPRELANRLGVLIEDGALRRRLGRAAREKAQRFDLDRMVARTFEVYETVLRHAR